MSAIYEGIEETAKNLGLVEDPQTWANTDSNVFQDLIAETKPKVIIEVGSWKGGSAIKMARICKELGLKPRIYCVDTWLGGVEHMIGEHATYRIPGDVHGYPVLYYQFLLNVKLAGHHDVIIPMPNTSVNIGRFLFRAKVQADLIYIDASHQYEDVIYDLSIFNHLLTPTGIMFGDDYNWPDVKRAADDFAKEQGQTLVPYGAPHYILRR